MPYRRACTGRRVVLPTCLMLLFLATSIKCLPSSLTNEVTLDEEPAIWSEWEEWSPCTRSCGAGITMQNRTCVRGNCVGPSVQYMSCCIQECSSDHVDFRAEQCQEYDDGNEQWVPAEEDNEGCSLRCINSVTGRPLLSFIRSGTSCKTFEGFNGVCLEKMCARVGCGGVLGSDQIEDSCHQCHSPESEPQYNCQRFSAVNTPNQAAMNGNLAIMTIPQGATTITISHILLPGQGMLALKSSLGTYYYSHGMVESLKDIAGTEFQRRLNESGDYPKEVLFSRGPLSETITVELTDVHQSAPMVEHEYYLIEQPDTNTGTHHANHTIEIIELPTEPGIEYAWMFSAFSECSVTCGTGVKIATANCRDLLHPERLDIPDGLCRHLEVPKPFPLLQKCHIQECLPSWTPGEWSECSARCGNGTQTRHLTCHQFLEEGKAAARISSRLCVDSKRPEVERVCTMEPCFAQWSTGPWSECPSQCGRWQQVRSVVCRETATGNEVNATLCNHTQKPLETQKCIVPCGQCYWYTSKFGKCNNACGYGTQTRRLRCRYIANNHRANESCCENLPPPNTTQPCYSTRGSNCNPAWITYPYGECQGDCTNCSEHAVMTKERKVVCGAVTSSGELVEFPDRECNATTKPNTRMPCVRTDCPQWRTSDWGECNASCGDGNRYRDVYCASVDGRQRLTDQQCRCMPFKPPYIQSCPNLPSCPTTSPPQCTANIIGDEACNEIIKSKCGSYDEYICCKTCKEKFSSMATI